MEDLEKERLKILSSLEARWAIYFNQKETLIWAIVAAYNAAVIAMLGSSALIPNSQNRNVALMGAALLLAFLTWAVLKILIRQLQLRHLGSLLVAACNSIIADILSGLSPANRDYSRRPLPESIPADDLHSDYYLPRCVLELRDNWQRAGAESQISEFAKFVKRLVWGAAVILYAVYVSLAYQALSA
jgi:hypothetical protein